ncbi:MAG: CDP-alcohol phosphatidyltransferase family protein [Actinobacteria bacterium]|nr:CDP-alcohol phosphatidyltransferase family protein [Actinomycetota bacterium]
MSDAAIPTRRFGPSALATTANIITIARLVLGVPFLVFVAAAGASWTAVAGWFALSVSDWYDGVLARREGTTRFGAFFDPLADKVITVGGFLALAIDGVFPWVAVAIIATREIAVSVYRTVQGRRGVSVPAMRLGKYKTALQLVTVGWALLPLTEDAEWLALSFLWAAVALTIVSAWELLTRPGVAPAGVEEDAGAL